MGGATIIPLSLENINGSIPVGAAEAAVPVSSDDGGEVPHWRQESPDIIKKPRFKAIGPVNGTNNKLKIATFFLQAEE